MATQVYNKRRVQRTQFRKLGFGAISWSSDTSSAPTIKCSRRAWLLGWNTATGRFTTVTSLTGTADAAVKTPNQFLRQC